jgi:hypothetical protein
MNYRPEDRHPGAPVDEYWELLRLSLRSALGRSADPDAPAAPLAPARAAGGAPTPTPQAAPDASRLPSDQAVDRYGWAM